MDGFFKIGITLILLGIALNIYLCNLTFIQKETFIGTAGTHTYVYRDFCQIEIDEKLIPIDCDLMLKLKPNRTYYLVKNGMGKIHGIAGELRK